MLDRSPSDEVISERWARKLYFDDIQVTIRDAAMASR
ncbi:hypothetical protein SM0020_25941 [Sinorhizobium meliloti CCNWSX0020]|uniref:Uncharacterized protein n=1 Tax=Sinorhizobium meliloti CCNWSX0020 TaxID=1107881 RepID=H0G6R2_RHIML|nr:hypothetical protein SM0020_25941 [Sinorhizobium meliloti CCNWSX0020]